ncbi:hypothetical protein D9619_007949 [Psilocybe cf. subviscida]|uniref:PX-domain-containing protein n=1 Tax=Psilocybe cf. subviscida TaxID=2480587 RepID=A0A8H5ESQ3_9AGAR|nr:hypothetical protein D9619_007949 [Psilocybe cf. subviscida]
MATLPRASRLAPTPVPQRPVSEFDAGINTSTAWTEHSLSRARSKKYDGLPLEEAEEEGELLTRPARALYAFEGKAEFRELCVEAGDELDVVKEDVGDGWSLVKDSTGEVGLLPRTYYTLTVDLAPAPDLQLDVTARREASNSSITPRNSQYHHQPLLATILPQNTGEWIPAFPSFRQSLLGGKSLNRFSSFVTSGAEAFLLNGGAPGGQAEERNAKAATEHRREDTSASNFEAREAEQTRLSMLGLGEADRHTVDAGLAGPTWRAKNPTFKVLVHSPSKRTNGLSGAYTMYNVTSIFAPAPNPVAADWVEVPDPDDLHPPSPTEASDGTRITVERRFSQFVMLHTVLSRRLPGIVLPPLPEKQYAGRFSDDFVEARRGDLERYLNKIVRHPVVRYAEILTFFLGCEDEREWKRLLPRYLSAPAAGPDFYARVYHPAFNVDLEDAEDAISSFRTHVRAVGKGVQGLRSVYGRVRQARLEMSKVERELSYALLSLITSTPIISKSTPGTTAEEEDDASSIDSAEKGRDRKKGLLNKDGAWCWREGCSDCLKLTKAVQKTSDTLQTVANLYDGHARRTQLATHESLKLMAHPSSLYESVITTHKSTLSRYKDVAGHSQANGSVLPDEGLAGRCETVLNTTMAEMDVYHAQKVEDMRMVATEHLDDEIAFYEQILSRLKTARATYEGKQYSDLARSPRLPSMYEKDLAFDPSNPHTGVNPHAPPRLLPQPCPHVFDSAPMRPVSVAIQEGVGMFLGDAGGDGLLSLLRRPFHSP